MNANEVTAVGEALRNLPSIDELLRTGTAQSLSPDAGPARLTELARKVVDDLRGELLDQTSRPAVHSHEQLLTEAAVRLEMAWLRRQQGTIRRVINATGVIIHTNLGRAPLSEKARRAIVNNAAGYCNVEYDLEIGARGKRGIHAEELIAELTGAESAIVVNNCAAAAFLVLSVFASGGEVVISRGELVEIGGDFRVPDVLVQSGAALREVGTTNRTKIADYEKAIGENTRLILRVHPSNYRIVGFTATPGIAALADLAHKRGILLYEDIGSGALLDLSRFGLRDEPVVSRSVSAGADIVTFSGDKLLGGPQAGIIAGRRDLIEKIRTHPLYRALRVDKLIYAALEATLEAYRRGTAMDEVPVLQMISADIAGLRVRTQKFADNLSRILSGSDGLSVEVISGTSVIGGGSAPDVHPESSLISLRRSGLSADALEEKLRTASPPVITRIENGGVLINLLTVSESEELELLEIVEKAG